MVGFEDLAVAWHGDMFEKQTSKNHPQMPVHRHRLQNRRLWVQVLVPLPGKSSTFWCWTFLIFSEVERTASVELWWTQCGGRVLTVGIPAMHSDTQNGCGCALFWAAAVDVGLSGSVQGIEVSP